MEERSQRLRPLLPPACPLDEKAAFLADMREAVTGNEQGQPYPGYPTLAGRLHIPADELQYDAHDRPVFPADPDASYTVFDHSVNENPRPPHAFHDNGGPLPPEEAAKISWGDMGQDSRRFPKHRYAVDMVIDPTIGAVIGPGYFYHPGKKLTVDLGIAACGIPAETKANTHGATLAMRASEEKLTAGGLYLCILPVRRSSHNDTGQLALPGGEIDEGEEALAAAIREAREETGLHFDQASTVSRGRRLVADPRLTTCTEAETELFVIDAGNVPAAQSRADGNEVEAADWLVADKNLLVPRRFFGSHRRMFLEVVDWYQKQHSVTIMENGLIVPKRAWIARRRSI